MKKRILAVLCALAVLSFGGCFQNAPQIENIDTAEAVNADNISQTDYTNDLEGLILYFKALHYLPLNTAPARMLAEVIGAKAGYRYIFKVNGSQTIVELYEFDTDALNEQAKRVIGEVKETGAFHLFNQEGIDADTTYPAVLSDNGKYMMLYMDPSQATENLVQTKSVQGALQRFYAEGSSAEAATASTPATTENSTAASQTEDSAAASQTEGSTAASQTEDSAAASQTEDSAAASQTEETAVSETDQA